VECAEGGGGGGFEWAAIGLEHDKFGPMFNAGGAILAAEWRPAREVGAGRGGTTAAESGSAAGGRGGGELGRGGEGGAGGGEEDGEGRIGVRLLGPGRLVLYASQRPKRVFVGRRAGRRVFEVSAVAGLGGWGQSNGGGVRGESVGREVGVGGKLRGVRERKEVTWEEDSCLLRVPLQRTDCVAGGGGVYDVEVEM
jgi:hypothetical protein